MPTTNEFIFGCLLAFGITLILVGSVLHANAPARHGDRVYAFAAVGILCLILASFMGQGITPAPSGVPICAVCEAECSADDLFCSNCGETLSLPSNTDPICIGCGDPIQPDANFCSNCGEPQSAD